MYKFMNFSEFEHIANLSSVNMSSFVELPESSTFDGYILLPYEKWSNMGMAMPEEKEDFGLRMNRNSSLEPSSVNSVAMYKDSVYYSYVLGQKLTVSDWAGRNYDEPTTEETLIFVRALERKKQEGPNKPDWQYVYKTFLAATLGLKQLRPDELADALKAAGKDTARVELAEEDSAIVTEQELPAATPKQLDLIAKTFASAA